MVPCTRSAAKSAAEVTAVLMSTLQGRGSSIDATVSSRHPGCRAACDVYCQTRHAQFIQLPSQAQACLEVGHWIVAAR